MEIIRRIIFYQHFFRDFYLSLSERVQEKYDFVLRRVSTENRLPLKIFRQIENKAGLYEIRVEMDGNIYRTFCCFDKGNLVVLFNSFQKKSQKTPPKEIERAERLMKEYQETKNNR